MPFIKGLFRLTRLARPSAPATAVLVLLALAWPLAGLSAPERDQADNSVWPGIKPLRLAFKVGSPDLLGLEVEGVVPGIGNWLGIWSGFTILPLGGSSGTTDGVTTEKSHGGLTHFGIGVNLYPLGGGQGLFTSLGFDRISAYNTVVATETNEKSFTNATKMGSVQLGYKYVGRLFTYTFSGGYGFNYGYKRPD